jgi:hypothetical protein
VSGLALYCGVAAIMLGVFSASAIADEYTEEPGFCDTLGAIQRDGHGEETITNIERFLLPPVVPGESCTTGESELRPVKLEGTGPHTLEVELEAHFEGIELVDPSDGVAVQLGMLNSKGEVIYTETKDVELNSVTNMFTSIVGGVFGIEKPASIRAATVKVATETFTSPTELLLGGVRTDARVRSAAWEAFER